MVYRTTVVLNEEFGELLKVYTTYYSVAHNKKITINKIVAGDLEKRLISDNDFINFLKKVKEFKPLYEKLINLQKSDKLES